MKNRLDAHALPFFKYSPPPQVTHLMMDAFVKRLTDSQFSSITVSQYFVILRKLLKFAIRHGFLREIPQIPAIKVANRPRLTLNLKEYAAVVRTAHRLARWGHQAPEIKASSLSRDQFLGAATALAFAPGHGLSDPFHGQQFCAPR